MSSHSFQLGIIGHPISHSLSPMLHSLFLQHAGLKGTYTAFNVAPADLGNWLNSDTAQALDGFNVTIPHKVSIVPYLSRISEEADFIGAVNTIYKTPQGWVGKNTDVIGFWQSLPQSLQQTLPQQHALVIGAGGTSRSVAYALIKQGVASLTFLVRNPSSALPTLQAVAQMNEYYRENQLPIFVESVLEPQQLTQYGLVVNTTPVGMSPQLAQSPLSHQQIEQLPQNGFVLDVIYTPLQTVLLQHVKQAGLQTQNGLPMLVYQGAKSFFHWTNTPVSPKSVTNAVQTLHNKLLH